MSKLNDKWQNKKACIIKKLGSFIASTGKNLPATQSEISTKIGINKTTLSEIENGRFTGSLDILERYLDALGLQLNIVAKKHQLPDWDEIEVLFKEDDD